MHPRAYCELVKWPWVAEIDGKPSQIESLVLGDLDDMSVDETNALKIVSLPFLATIEFGDQDISEFLANLSRSDPDGLTLLLTHESLTAEDDTPMQILYLGTKDPEAAARIADQDWVRDGVSNREHVTLNYLQEAAIASKAFFRYLMDRNPAWIPAETGRAETTLYRLVKWSTFNEEQVIGLLSMPFMETIEFIDSLAIQVLYNLASANPEAGQRILSQPPLQDGIRDEEAIYVLIFNLEENSPQSAEAIKGLPWVEDGIEYVLYTGEVYQGTEAENVWTLVRLGEKSQDFLLELTTKTWVRDGISNIVGESDSLVDLDIIVSYDPLAALRVLQLPMMNSYHREMFTALQRLKDARWKSREAFDRELERLGVAGGS